MEYSKILSTTQEQAIAAWNEHLAFLRISTLTEELANQEINEQNAMDQINKLVEFISQPEHILGNKYSKLGEIAEHTQVRFSNAENLIHGEKPSHFIDDVPRLDKADYIRYGKMVQSKFYNDPKNTLKAIEAHLKKYPDFIADKGEYDIPKDQFDILIDIYQRGKSNRSSLHTTNEYGNEETIYKNIIKFENENNVKFTDVIKPSVSAKADVQVKTIDKTIKKETTKIKDESEQIKDVIRRENAPNFHDACKATAAGAISEGAMSFLLAFMRIKKEKKKISNFSDDDWISIFKESGISTVKGGIRGSSLYIITNFAQTPAPIANAMITATFGLVTQSKMLSDGKITNEEFVDNSEMMCLDVSLSALSSIIGQTIIPIPVIGAIIGNTIGMFLEEITISYLDSKEAKILEKYESEAKQRVQKLIENQNNELSSIISKYIESSSLLDLAFSADANICFENSVLLAKCQGVPDDRIVKNTEEGYMLFEGMEPISFS